MKVARYLPLFFVFSAACSDAQPDDVDSFDTGASAEQELLDVAVVEEPLVGVVCGSEDAPIDSVETSNGNIVSFCSANGRTFLHEQGSAPSVVQHNRSAVSPCLAGLWASLTDEPIPAGIEASCERFYSLPAGEQAELEQQAERIVAMPTTETSRQLSTPEEMCADWRLFDEERCSRREDRWWCGRATDYTSHQYTCSGYFGDPTPCGMVAAVVNVCDYRAIHTLYWRDRVRTDGSWDLSFPTYPREHTFSHFFQLSTDYWGDDWRVTGDQYAGRGGYQFYVGFNGD